MTPELAKILLSPWALALLGLCIGSFLNVVIYRLPQMLERGWKLDSAEMLGVKIETPPEITLSKPRSRCPKCSHAIAWHENVPVLSYVRLGGKCSECKTRISPRYPFIEIVTAVLFAAAAHRFGAQPTTLLWCGFIAVLVALAGIDWDTTLLPDNLTLPLLWAGLVSAAVGWTIPLSMSVWGAVVGYLSLWTVYWIFKKATGKEGMGHGDFKLLAALGAWLGVQMILPIVLAASVIGAIVGIGLKISGGLREGRYVPFGPFLAGAGLVVMLAGSVRVLDWLGWG
ncbi:MAG: prepilin peptidase [Burkholderiales bacterium]|nr:prepilin peptidase [Burkholderiales bacterium]